MPIYPERIEAAARAIAEDDGLDWDRMIGVFRDGYLGRATLAIVAAYPELASDPPTAWVAPMEPGLSRQQIDRIVHETLAETVERYGARDAHTKEQT